LGFAKGAIAPVMIFLSYLMDKISGLFYPLYQAVEKVIYPKDRMEEILSWHMRLPELSQMLGFPIFGFIFGYVLTNPENYRNGFIIFGLVSIIMIFYILKYLPKLDISERLETKRYEFRSPKEFGIFILAYTLYLIAWSLAPGIVFVNYIVNVLHLTLFEVALVESFMSLSSIISTYFTEKIPSSKRFEAIGIGLIFIFIWALIMYLNPPFEIVLIAYFLCSFGDTLTFPFMRGWFFSLIPKDRASEFTSIVSSYVRLLGIFTPLISSFLASLNPTLPYLVSMILFISEGLVLIILARKFK